MRVDIPRARVGDLAMRVDTPRPRVGDWRCVLILYGRVLGIGGACWYSTAACWGLAVRVDNPRPRVTI